MSGQSLAALAVVALASAAAARNANATGASELISRGITALGGDALRNITTVTYQTTSVYRSNTLMENYDSLLADAQIATAGTQNMSFQYTSSGVMSQRIDRFHQISQLWAFGSPTLVPRNYSLVVKSGDEGFACYVDGSNNIFSPPDIAAGYVESFVAEYFVQQMYKFSPMLLTQFSPNSSDVSTVSINGVEMPAVHDLKLDICVVFEPKSALPFIIRSTEDHELFGLTNRDTYLLNYTSVGGILFPHRFITFYNGQEIEDFDVSEVRVNPSLPGDFFSGLASDDSTLPPAAPEANETYANAEVGAWTQNMLWSSAYAGRLNNVTAVNPIESLPNYWRVTFNDAPGYNQMVIAFEDAVIVTDAPPHQSELMVQWVQENIGRPITHVWPTHHHHDHAYGINEFVSTGAKLIVPEVVETFWKGLPNADIITYSEDKPFIHRDSSLQARFIWHPDAPHSEDWGYGMVTAACPNADGSIAVIEADLWNPGFANSSINTQENWDWLTQAVKDGLTPNALITPAHGQVAPLRDLIDFIGIPYPNLTTTDWKLGGSLC